MQELGSSGRLNFFWELMAAGKGGAENMAATTLMRVIHECICSGFLGERPTRRRALSGTGRVTGRGTCPTDKTQAPLRAPGALPPAPRQPTEVGRRGARQSTALTPRPLPSGKGWAGGSEVA